MTLATRVAAALLGGYAALVGGAAALAAAAGLDGLWRVPFRLVCHGLPERCLTVLGTAMPVCARCTAIYAGIVAGAILVLSARRLIGRAAAGGWRVEWLLLLVVPLAVDGLTQAAGLRESTNELRVWTGAAAGFSFISWSLIRIERQVVANESARGAIS